MKKLLLTIIFSAFALCQAQTERHLYDIRGDAQPTSAKTMAICFDTYICHGCMNTLAAFCKEFHTKNPDIEIVVLIRGVSYMGARRSTTADLRDYYTDEERPDVVYDLNPKQRKQYFNKHKISSFPALILFSDKHKKECYIPERKLFDENETGFTLSTYAQKKINNYFFR